MELRAGESWQPTRIERVNDVLNTSTKPLLVVTDIGLALLKYIGNAQGEDALVAELLAAELAAMVGLRTPDFAVERIPEIATRDPFITAKSGPAFFSRWEPATTLSPNSQLLRNLRDPRDIARLVVFDTWVRNKDRFSDDIPGGVTNYDNILIIPDKQKSKLLVIDHSHAFAETTLEGEINAGWANEELVYGLFNEFAPMLRRRDVESAINVVCSLAPSDIRDVCRSSPAEWGFSTRLADTLAELLVERAARMRRWLPSAIFDQFEMDLEGKEV
ncbi:hypothetical protein RRU01S_11_00260 [Agrobacterium rubi TR3 = NBRC 13261]|uniref:HipA-like kinase domain-containing protein n=1 Tax=Agrobacterium rubi TR3 = NBRC 13261 TaxID=1368415 RepID=A0A081CUM7_9HYPH|nr:HipA family kinase [Agrobacterium rubi]MBP1879226.1 hypothetical protein [Agrobacterium rubi]MCL6652524.1 hypothetical protein [Agrobacterium rubi]GAK70373.1 hypothetical protein RRU01S_11_00260 [Agrobacterium rubi TR3 = NBRC 13261]